MYLVEIRMNILSFLKIAEKKALKSAKQNKSKK